MPVGPNGYSLSASSMAATSPASPDKAFASDFGELETVAQGARIQRARGADVDKVGGLVVRQESQVFAADDDRGDGFKLGGSRASNSLKN